MLRMQLKIEYDRKQQHQLMQAQIIDRACCTNTKDLKAYDVQTLSTYNLDYQNTSVAKA